ncbi:hypothetical protein BDN67DRAFT_970638 [Paxillus ammoniavirescens]|nr:hypothetical protein BDN67DRAFT_970638 [Paxillus ammoniavirescens]
MPTVAKVSDTSGTNSDRWLVHRCRVGALVPPTMKLATRYYTAPSTSHTLGCMGSWYNAY